MEPLIPFAARVTGLPALLIILVILVILVLGVISFFRLTARGAKKVAGKMDKRNDGE